MEKKTYIEKMEEAAGITTPAPAPPKKGFVAPPYAGPRPWRGPVETRPKAEPTPKDNELYPLESIIKDKKKSSGPASGVYEHNSPAKPL